MDSIKTSTALATALMLAACGQGQAPSEQPSPTPAAVETPGPAPVQTPAPVTNGADSAPPPLTPEAERSETGARNILVFFARSIELREFDKAWALLSPADQQKWSKPQFAALFADLGKITVAVPTGEMEGAAGSSYYTAPVTITANDRDGRPVRIEGKAILRRVNDVDGATPAQLRWHFETLTLDSTH